jgi:16S rRNA (uracil1498-N3)-methyltransferase
MPYFFGRRAGRGVEIVGGDARHLAHSLRARPGERISVVVPDDRAEGPTPTGRLLTVRLERVGPDRVVGVVEAETEHRPEPERRLVLAVAMLPASALDLVLSRCTEAGVHSFVLVAADRSVARGARPQRWAAVCREAAMLAGRLAVPEVRGPRAFAEAWAGAPAPYLLDRSGGPLPRPLEDPATLFVGPEGGWSPAERERAGGRVVSLGPRNLRADTAALVAVALGLA